LSIEVPIIQAPIAPDTSAQLFAAVSNAGELQVLGLHFTQLKGSRSK
jgi:NAD(P)H-dependent flavin oxidoreductase YrpB (nitropropane dioxygenase family)